MAMHAGINPCIISFMKADSHSLSDGQDDGKPTFEEQVRMELYLAKSVNSSLLSLTHANLTHSTL